MLSTQESLEQTYRVRLALEPAALLEPGYRLDADTADRLRAAEERLLAGAIETDSADALHERGVRFHEALVERLREPVLPRDRSTHQPHSAPVVRCRSMLDRTRYPQHCREHLKRFSISSPARGTMRPRRRFAAISRGPCATLRKIKALLDAKGNGAVLE